MLATDGKRRSWQLADTSGLSQALAAKSLVPGQHVLPVGLKAKTKTRIGRDLWNRSYGGFDAHLLSFHSKKMRLPQHPDHAPKREYLYWHRRQVF